LEISKYLSSGAEVFDSHYLNSDKKNRYKERFC